MGEQPGDPLGGAVAAGAPTQQLEQRQEPLGILRCERTYLHTNSPCLSSRGPGDERKPFVVHRSDPQLLVITEVVDGDCGDQWLHGGGERGSVDPQPRKRGP